MRLPVFTFHFPEPKQGARKRLPKLPQVMVPFGLYLVLHVTEEGMEQTDRPQEPLHAWPNPHGGDGRGPERLKDLKNLTSLNLCSTQVTDEGLKELKDLKNLISLNLSETKVTDAGLKELKASRTSPRLTFSRHESDGRGPEGTQGPQEPHCRFDLHDTKVTDAGLKELKTSRTSPRLMLARQT